MATTVQPKTPPLPVSVDPFPFLDLKAQFETIRNEIMPAVQQVLETQHFVLGPEVDRFEREVSSYVECKYAFGCASGSDALLLALMALGVDAGDEVITTPFTFGATPGAIARLKARPVFVDIDPVTYNIDPAKIEAAITGRTRAILPVHLFGLSADMGPIMETTRKHNLPVIEDAAQAIGARYQDKAIGSIGTIGCFSFFPSKNLGGAGDGGLVSTSDPELADRLKILRLHGCRQKYSYEVIGINSRLDAIQAAILRVKLKYLDLWAEGRRRNAGHYRSLLAGPGTGHQLTLPVEPQGCRHVYNQFVIRTSRRNALREHLKRAGIPTEIYYPSPLHLEKAYSFLGHKPGDFPESEAAAREALAIPIFAELTSQQLGAVAGSIESFFENKEKAA